MSEYNIFLVESASKNKEGGFKSVSQDLIISGINQDLSSNNFIGKLIKEGSGYKIIFREGSHLNLLEKISKTLSLSNFNISVDENLSPEMTVGSAEPTLTYTTQIEVEEPQAPTEKKQSPRLFRQELKQAFHCPHLSEPGELPGILNPEKMAGFGDEDAYNCLLIKEGLRCPIMALCYEQQLLGGVAQVINHIRNDYDVFIFDFQNHGRQLSLIINKGGEMAVAPKKAQ